MAYSQPIFGQGLCAGRPFVPNLLVAYPFAENAGLTVADSVAGLTGTLTNMEIGDWVAGRQPGEVALNLDGTNEYISVADGAATKPQAHTLMALVRPDTFPYAYISVASKEASNLGYTLLVKSTGKLAVYLQKTGGGTLNYDGTGAYTLSAGAWTVIGYTFDGSNLNGYVNGLVDKTASTGAFVIPHTTNPLEIGSWFQHDTSKRYWDGLVQGFWLWNVALTQPQVAAFVADVWLSWYVLGGRRGMTGGMVDLAGGTG